MATKMKTCAKCEKQKPLSDFHKQEGGRYGLQSECKKCKHKYRKIYLIKNKDNVNKQRRKRGDKHKKQLIAYKGGKCQICGYNDCIAALDFHHVKREKKFDIGRGGGCYSLRKLKEEVDKCILVCSNCHRKIHYMEDKR